ncbi:hypothetical protein [Streptomyces sp. G1]|uniref:hypothetical protein n=1 Tax=Streptomyces sp. G1 TaxID=361572 RepID=UPI00202F0506|nr:hypothetical protein [Streptomyces sp. G1]MCM1967154.1 hypothetical protein [Streptomyces sp. G1]
MDVMVKTCDVRSFGKGLLKMGRGFAAGFSPEVDEEAMNAAVEAYNNRVHRQVAGLNKLHEALDEAYLRAPAFRAESARAESFGARALTGFETIRSTRWPGTTKAITNTRSTSRTRRAFSGPMWWTSMWARRMRNWNKG